MKNISRSLVLAASLLAICLPLQAQVQTEKTKVLDTPFGGEIKHKTRTDYGDVSVTRKSRRIFTPFGMIHTRKTKVRDNFTGDVRVHRGFTIDR